ncbi:hypothetical protein Q5752_001963 [Cryptotrichosporon argae]
MPEPFGSFGWICRHTVLPQCNLFFAQLYNHDSDLTTLFPSSSLLYSDYNVTSTSVTDDTNVMAARSVAGTGVGASCEIARAGHGSKGDIALMVVSALSLLIAAALAAHATKRRAAVGRVELRTLFVLYGVLCALQLVDMSSVLEQGSTGIIIVSAIHTALFVTFFWLLLANAVIATQVVEDGTPAALVPLSLGAVLFFVPTLYVALSVGFRWNTVFQISSTDPADLKSTALFVLTLLWPALAALIYVALMLYIIVFYLAEVKPAVFLVGAAALFIGAQVIFFLVAQPLCNASNGKLNSAFISTLLDTLAMIALHFAWIAITEEDWAEEGPYDAWA